MSVPTTQSPLEPAAQTTLPAPLRTAPSAPSAPGAPSASGPALAPVAPVTVFTSRAPGGAAAAAVAPPTLVRRSSPARSLRDHWLVRSLVVGVLTGFAVLIISGRVVTEGPVLATLTRTHGIHLGDLYVVAGWTLAVLPQLPRRSPRW